MPCRGRTIEVIYRSIETPVPSPEAMGRVAEYEGRRARSGIERDALRRRWNRLGNLRLLAFFACLILVGVGLQTGLLGAYVVAAITFVLFVLLIARHRRVGRALNEAAALHDVNAESLLRCARDWETLPLKFSHLAPAGHAFAADLDLFGHASLFHLLETAETPMGADRLRDWLLRPGQPAEIERRQQAVAALAEELEWRQALQVDGRLVRGEPIDPEPLLAWCEGEPWLAGHPAVRLMAALAPVVFGIAAAGALFGMLPSILLVVIAAGNILLTQVLAADARIRIALVARHYESISQYARLLARIETMPGAAPLLDELRTRLVTNGHVASELLHTLGQRAAFLEACSICRCKRSLPGT
jgi:MutS domain III